MATSEIPTRSAFVDPDTGELTRVGIRFLESIRSGVVTATADFRPSVTVNPGDDWVRILEEAVNGSRFTFNAGTYTADAPVRLRVPMSIECENFNGAQFNATFDLDGCGRVSFTNTKHIHPTDSTQNMFDVHIAQLRLFDVNIDGTNGAGRCILQSASSEVQISANNRTVTIDYRGNSNGQEISCRDGCALRINNTSPNITRILSDAGDEIVQFSSAVGYLANVTIQGSGKTGGSVGIGARRGSHVRVNRNQTATDVSISNCGIAMRSRHGGEIFVDGTSGGNFRIVDCDTGLDSTIGGRLRYDTNTVTFSSVNTNTVANAANIVTVE